MGITTDWSDKIPAFTHANIAIHSVLVGFLISQELSFCIIYLILALISRDGGATFQIYTGCVIKNGHPNSTKVGAFFVMVLMFCDSIGSKRT